jgi:hypothetical protein
MPGDPVRLVVLTGTCAVGKSTFAARLQGRIGGQVFHMDDYISAPPPPGYPPEWFRRRVGYLPEIGQKLAAALETSPITTFEGVLVEAEEVPTLAHSASLSYPSRSVFVVILERSLEECWVRKSRERGFREQYPWIDSAGKFAQAFYDGYRPKGVDPDMVLKGAHIDDGFGVEQLLRRLRARGLVSSEEYKGGATDSD